MFYNVYAIIMAHFPNVVPQCDATGKVSAGINSYLNELQIQYM